ncbi:MAG: glycosyltransferase [Candidatus Aminicenantes bacterium]|nr:glycosyltransferase [Candidatus Aminicenantes bacterium]
MAFKNYGSALRERVKSWISRIGHLDIIVGIPCYNNEDTISHVVTQAGIGLKKFFPGLKTGIFVADGGSTDNTRENAYVAEVPSGIEKIVEIYRGTPGKGTSFRAIFEAACSLNVKAIVVVDSDLRSITPEWVKLLAEPIFTGKFDYILPYYKRHKYDGTITNMLVYPLTRALYGKRIRQPIGGDFGLSPKLAKLYVSKDVWTTDVAKFGIDIWMTTIAINETERIAQVNLGTKVHDAKDPAADLSQMFTQVISTVFYLMGEYRDSWTKIKGSENVPIIANVSSSMEIPDMSVNLQKMEIEFAEGFKHFEAFYKAILSSEAFEGLTHAYIERESGGHPDISAELWARIVYEFATTYQTWNRNRRRLVNIMAPLYFGRTATYVRQVMDLDWEEAERVIEQQALVFEKYKDYLKGLLAKADMVDSGLLSF